MNARTTQAAVDALLCLLMVVLLVVLSQLCGSCAHGEEISYEECYADYQAGWPAVVVVSAPYCPACHALIRTLRDRRAGIRFAVLDVTSPLANQDGTAGQPIPRIFVFRLRLPIVHKIGNVGVLQIHRLIGEGGP